MGDPKSLSPVRAAAWQPSSGIFAPTTGLDSRLFDNGALRPQVRGAVMERLDRCIRVDVQLAGSDWQDWMKVYLAGGSASEWAGNRPNEQAQDLDVLVGIDLKKAQGYSSFEGMDEGQAATALNAAFRAAFDETGAVLPGVEGTWDLTAYCNPGAYDIRDIKPYAAWDLSDNRWAVKPPHLPGHSLADFDPAVLAQARAVAAEARAILRMPEPLRTREATALWDRIHAGRSQAFSDHGQGWADPANVVEKWLAYAPHDLLGHVRELALAKTAARMVDVYHATLPEHAEALARGAAPHDGGLFVSTHQHSPYMDKTGPARMHLRVPEHLLEDDPSELSELPGGNWPGAMNFAPGERHYWFRADDVRPYHQGTADAGTRFYQAEEWDPKTAAVAPDGPLYHGSMQEFAKGTVLTPGGRDANGYRSIFSGDYVYATTNPKAAEYFGSMHDTSPLTDRDVHVHRVEPVGEVEPDEFPAGAEDGRYAQGNYRAKALRVVDHYRAPGHWAAAERKTAGAVRQGDFLATGPSELPWGDEEWAAARREPWHAASQLAQEQVRWDHPRLLMPFPHGEEGDRMVGHILGYVGYGGDRSGAFVARHPHPENGTSNPSWLGTRPGVALHPDKWDYGTVIHEAAHHAVIYDHAAAPNEHQPDEQVHGPEWASHYAQGLNKMSPGAGDDFLGHHQRYRAMIAEGLQYKRPRDLDAADARRGLAVREGAAQPSQALYHGSKQLMNPGDEVTPDHPSATSKGTSGWTYATPHVTRAWMVAKYKPHDGPPRVYEVAPTGAVVHDPEMKEGESFRSRSPLRVVRELPQDEIHAAMTAQWGQDAATRELPTKEAVSLEPAADAPTIVATSDRQYPRPYTEDEGRVYLRFGDWHPSERSRNYVTGHPEVGVSVYDLNHRGEPVDPDPFMEREHHHDESCEPGCDLDEWNDEYGNDTTEEMRGRVQRAEHDRRTQDHEDKANAAHLVRGELAGIGHDGEPLLQHVRRVGDWMDHRHLFIPGAERHRLARDEHDEDYEPPEEQPMRREAAASDWRGDWSDYHFDPAHPDLEGMHEVARNSPDFKTFLGRNILRHNYHGRYWHLTHDPDFKIRSDYAPQERSSMGSENEEHGLMVSTDPETWHEDMPHRQYAAEIALHGKPGEDYEDTSRGFGHEIWVNSPHKAEVLGVYPYEEGMRKHNHFYSRIVPSTEEDFRQIWDRAHGNQHTAATGYEDLKPRSAMIYLDLPEGTVRQVPGGVTDNHITLVYLGSDVSDEAFAEACRRAKEAAARVQPLSGVLRGVDTFPPSDSSDGKVPAFVPAYIPRIGQLRQLLEDLSASEHRHYKPHVTLGYYAPDEDLPAPHPPVQVRFSHLHVKRGNQVVSFALGSPD